MKASRRRFPPQSHNRRQSSSASVVWYQIRGVLPFDYLSLLLLDDFGRFSTEAANRLFA
jgi:hypothetical protein